MLISSILISWYLEKKRNLPWRNTRNPYHIWVSEVVLQQTRVAQGLDYYLQFISHFPTISSLANAHEDDVLKQWQGLGYYSRARNLQKGARQVQEIYNGILPNNYEQLLKITGIGPYTAAAIASFAFNEPVALADGNVNRVLSRLFGMFDPINSTVGAKLILTKATEILDRANPATHNQAIMEFGATHCTPKKPKCTECPLQQICYAYIHDQIAVLPIKIAKGATRDRYFHYVLFIHHNSIYVKKRPVDDIWRGLYEFPVLETISSEQPSTSEWKNLLNTNTIPLLQKNYRHLLSHQTIYASFYVARSEEPAFEKSHEIKKIPIAEISQYPVHKLISRFIDDFNMLNEI